MALNMRQVETKRGGDTSLLEALREELEGLSSKKAVVARKSSARARIRHIRNSHVAQCGRIFYRKNRHGILEFNPGVGSELLRKLYKTT